MPAKPRQYRKLGRASKSLFQVGQLWAAADHLLLSQSNMGIEKYRRFYFHEVEALIIRKTVAGRVWNFVFASLALLFLGGALLAIGETVGFRSSLSATLSQLGTNNDSQALVIFLLSGCALFLLILLIHALLGPTCQFYLQTRPGLERLRMVRRSRAALKLRAQLVPLLTNAQTHRETAAGLSNSEMESTSLRKDFSAEPLQP